MHFLSRATCLFNFMRPFILSPSFSFPYSFKAPPPKFSCVFILFWTTCPFLSSTNGTYPHSSLLGLVSQDVLEQRLELGLEELKAAANVQVAAIAEVEGAVCERLTALEALIKQAISSSDKVTATIVNFIPLFAVYSISSLPHSFILLSFPPSFTFFLFFCLSPYLS